MRSALLAALFALLPVARAQDATHDPPHGLTLDAKEPGKVTVVWVPAEDNRNVKVVGHEVWRALEGAPWELVAELPADAGFHIDRKVGAGKRYLYKVATKAGWDDAHGGAALPVTLARRESEPAGPVLALRPFYLELLAVTVAGPQPSPDDTATLHVHRWSDEAGAWERGPETIARTGDPVGRQSVEGDFRTGATLLAAWEAEGDREAHVRVRLESGEELTVGALDLPPESVWTAPASRPRRKPPEKPAAEKPAKPDAPDAPRPPAGGVATTRQLPFPEPSRTGEVKGKKVLWEVLNETPYRITVSYAGPSTGQVVVEPGATSVLRLVRGGDYILTGKATDTDRVAPATGRFSLVSGARYRSTFRRQSEKP